MKSLTPRVPKRRIRLAHLVAALDHRAAGISGILRALVKELAATRDLDMEVFGLEYDYAEEVLSEYAPVTARAFPIVGPRRFGYSPSLLHAVLSGGFDLVHVHGLWMYPSWAALRWGRQTHRPHMVTVYGMLEPWALRRSRAKKLLVGAWFERKHLRRAACLHASCLAEVHSIRRAGLRNPVCAIPNGIEVPRRPPRTQPPWEGLDGRGRKILLYLGRLHPIKGLPLLLQAWERARRNPKASGWLLVIAGWGDHEHEGMLRAQVADLGLADSVRLVGPVFGERKHAALWNADGFVLTSYSESLPMAALEGLAYQLPVLLTPACHLPECFAAGAGFQVLPNVDSVAKGLLTLFELDDQTRHEMGLRGRALVEERFAWPRIADEMAAVYRWLAGRAGRPDCVVESLGSGAVQMLGAR